MNQKLLGITITTLRKKNHMTQAALAANLNVSDKAISKWEIGLGYPEIGMLSNIFSISKAVSARAMPSVQAVSTAYIIISPIPISLSSLPLPQHVICSLKTQWTECVQIRRSCRL